MSDSLRPHGLQHARLPCPSPTPRACSNSCPLSQWCYPTISSSVVPFSSCLQSFPASGAFLVSQFFASGGQSTGTSASASVLPILFRTDLLYNGLVGSPCSPRDSWEFSPHHSSKASVLQHSAFFVVQHSHPYMTTGKAIPLTRRTFVNKVMSLLFNMLSRFVIQAAWVAQMVKHLPTVEETRVQSLGWEDPLRKEMAAHSSTLAWKIPWTEHCGRLQSMGSQKVRHNWATSLSLSGWS